MRVLAKQLGVQASSLYHHFPDRHSLEQALGQEATTALIEQLDGATNIDAVAAGYLEFARSNAAFYHLVTAEADRLWIVLLKWGGELAGEENREPAAVAVWSYLHGYAKLEATGSIGSLKSFEPGWVALRDGLAAKKNIL